MTDLVAEDAAAEITRLRAALQHERERRVMAALWGSTDEDCPRAFSLYRTEDQAATSPTGIVAYGCQFGDGTVVLRWCGDSPSTSVWDDMMAMRAVHTKYAATTVTWLSEDLDDLTDTIADDLFEKLHARAKSDAVRVAVAEAISKADPVDTTWHDCLNLADAALNALFAVDEHDEGERSAWVLAAP